MHNGFLLIWRWQSIFLLFFCSFNFNFNQSQMKTCESDIKYNGLAIISVFRMNTYNGQIFPIRLWFGYFTSYFFFFFLIICRFFNQELVHLNGLFEIERSVIIRQRFSIVGVYVIYNFSTFVYTFIFQSCFYHAIPRTTGNGNPQNRILLRDIIQLKIFFC